MTLIKHTKFLDFKTALSPSGKDWFYVHRTNDSNNHDSAVVITTLIKKNDKFNFLFLITQRPPLVAESKAKFCLESPAGLIGDTDKDEKLIECAKKELLEETGYISNEIILEAQNYSTSSGLSSETLSFVTAIVSDNDLIKKPLSDGGIIVDRIEIQADKIYEFILSLDSLEYSIATATITGIFFALRRISIA